nr:obscurin-like [Arachis hypogaea]
MASVDALSQWVDVTVLGEEPSVDTEFITHLRTHYRICTSEEDEPKYELVVPGPEDRVCFGRADETAAHFFFMYEKMAKKNAQESYQRVQEAKAKSRARSGGVRMVVSPPPPPRNVGTSSQPIVISSSASSLPPPPVRPTPEPEPKKRKTLEIIESPPRSKDAPSSSTAPPTSSSTPASGVPPDSAGGDPLEK